MEPIELKVSKIDDKEMVFVVWSDGHKSRYGSFELRNSCPCAMCQGEPGIFGRKYNPLKTTISTDVVPQEIIPVGRYGLKIEWSDGHNLGIYTFDYLRKLCACEECTNLRTL